MNRQNWLTWDSGRIRGIGPTTEFPLRVSPGEPSRAFHLPVGPGLSPHSGHAGDHPRPGFPPTTGTRPERVRSAVLPRTPGSGFCCGWLASQPPVSIAVSRGDLASCTGGWTVATMGLRVARTQTQLWGTAAVRHRRVTTIVVVVIYIYLLLLLLLLH